MKPPPLRLYRLLESALVCAAFGIVWTITLVVARAWSKSGFEPLENARTWGSALVLMVGISFFAMLPAACVCLPKVPARLRSRGLVTAILAALVMLGAPVLMLFEDFPGAIFAFILNAAVVVGIAAFCRAFAWLIILSAAGLLLGIYAGSPFMIGFFIGCILCHIAGFIWPADMDDFVRGGGYRGVPSGGGGFRPPSGGYMPTNPVTGMPRPGSSGIGKGQVGSGYR